MKDKTESKDKKYEKRYLQIFLSYLVLLIFGIIITLIELNLLYKGEEEIAISFGVGFIGLIVFMFNIYNVLSLAKMLKIKSSKGLILLSLTEILLLICIIFSLFINITFPLWLIGAVKITQIIFVIYFLKKK